MRRAVRVVAPGRVAALLARWSGLRAVRDPTGLLAGAYGVLLLGGELGAVGAELHDQLVLADDPCAGLLCAVAGRPDERAVLHVAVGVLGARRAAFSRAQIRVSAPETQA